MREALFAVMLASILLVQSVFAAPHVQEANMSTFDSTVTVVLRVVGVGNTETLHTSAQVAVTCLNGQSLNVGLGATVSAPGGPQNVTMSADLAWLGCDSILTAELLSYDA